MREEDTAAAKSPQRIAPPQGLCEQCQVTFIPKRQTKGRFCSPDCYRTWWRANGQREYSKRGLARLEQLRSEGRDPRSTEQAAWKRRMAFRATALTLAPEDEESDDLEWAERGAYWEEQADPPAPGPVLRRGWERRPLILAGRGVRLRIDHGTLLVRHGFTHSPQQVKEDRFFPGHPTLPSRIVLLDADGYISLDVIAWLSRQRIPVIVLDWMGEVINVMRTDGMASDPALREAQLAALTNTVGLQVATWLIREKIGASQQALRTLPSSPQVEEGILRLQRYRASLQEGFPVDVQELLLLEARAAFAYFAAWQSLSLRWQGTSRKPIPAEWRRMASRRSLLGGGNRNSNHPVSSMQNYSFRVLESQVRMTVSAQGLDPEIGYLHAMRRGRPALVFDLMEPLRPLVDRLVLDLVRSRTFAPGDFHITDRGICRLHPQLARVLASESPREETVGQVIAVAKSKLEAAIK